MIFTLILIAVFASVGFQFAMEPDMILNFYKNFLARINYLRFRKKQYGWLIAKPLGFCITCNSHWVGFVLFYNNFEVFQQYCFTKTGTWVLLEFSSIAVSGISTLIWFIYNKFR